jgi:uncharacterized protein YjcR
MRMSNVDLSTTALEIANKYKEESDDLVDILLTKRPNVGRAVQLWITGGHKVAEIADLVGVRPKTVRAWLRDPDIKSYIAEFQKENQILVRSKIQAGSIRALETMIDLLDSPIDGNRLQAAKDLMDRAGFKPEQKVKKEVTVKTIEQQLDDLINDTIEVEYSEVDHG